MFVKYDPEAKRILAISETPITSSSFRVKKFPDITIADLHRLKIVWNGTEPVIEEKSPEELQLLNIIVNRNKAKKKERINHLAREYILNFLKKLDWGETYEECLTELTNSAQVIETKILYFLKPHKSDLTLTEIRKKITEYITGTYTAEDAIQEMQEAGLTEEEIQKYLSLLGSAAEIAKLSYWVESVWDKVEELEKQIEEGTYEDIVICDPTSPDFLKKNPFPEAPDV